MPPGPASQSRKHGQGAVNLERPLTKMQTERFVFYRQCPVKRSGGFAPPAPTHSPILLGVVWLCLLAIDPHSTGCSRTVCRTLKQKLLCLLFGGPQRDQTTSRIRSCATCTGKSLAPISVPCGRHSSGWVVSLCPAQGDERTGPGGQAGKRCVAEAPRGSFRNSG